MAVYAICEECDHEYRLADSMAGKAVRCKECGTVIDIPPVSGTRSSRRRSSADTRRPARSRREKNPPRAARPGDRSPPRRSRRDDRGGGGISFWQIRLIVGGIGAICAIIGSALGLNKDDRRQQQTQYAQSDQQRAFADVERSNQQLRDSVRAAEEANASAAQANRDRMAAAQQRMEAQREAMQNSMPDIGGSAFPSTGFPRSGMSGGSRSGIGRQPGAGSPFSGSGMPGSGIPGMGRGSSIPGRGSSIPGMGGGAPGIGRGGSGYGSGIPGMGSGRPSGSGIGSSGFGGNRAGVDRGKSTARTSPPKPAPKHPAFGKIVLSSETLKRTLGEDVSGFEVATESEVFVVGGQTIRIWRDGKWKEVDSGVDWTGEATVFDLSADGKMAAIVADVRLTTQIGSLDTTTGEITVASSHRVGNRAVAARLSRDGSRLCVIDQWGGMGIFKLPKDLDAETKIGTSMASVEALEISNDGRKVVVVSNGQLFEVGKGVQKSSTQFGAKAYSIAPMADKVLIDFDYKLTLTNLSGLVLASVETNDQTYPFFEKKGYARSPLQINREGTLACFCTFKGRQCVIVGVTDSELTIKGALPLDGNLKPLCARFTSEGRVAVLAEVGINEGYQVVVCDVSE